MSLICCDTTHVTRHATSVTCGHISRDMAPNVTTHREISRHFTMSQQKCLPDTDMSRRHLMTCQTCHMTCQEDATQVASDDMSCRQHVQHRKYVYTQLPISSDRLDGHTNLASLMICGRFQSATVRCLQTDP